MRMIVFSLALVLSGCSTTAYLYPVEGPVSKLTPLPTIEAKVDGILSNTGGLSFTTHSGENCTGRWSSVAPQAVSQSFGTLFTQYGSTIGINQSNIANIPGVNAGQAFASCSQGTSFDIEFITGSGTANGNGIAKDSEGNVYKMIF